MANNIERNRVLEVLQEIEDADESMEYVTMELYSDGSGAVGLSYSEERTEYFSFGDLDEFLKEAGKFLDKKNVIEVLPSNVIFEDEEFMLVRKEAK